jgi:hypothetical protein
VHAVGGDAPRRETSTQVLQKYGWSTKIEVCVARHTEFIEHGYAEVSSGIKIYTQTILGTRPAVHYAGTSLRQRLHKPA